MHSWLCTLRLSSYIAVTGYGAPCLAYLVLLYFVTQRQDRSVFCLLHLLDQTTDAGDREADTLGDGGHGQRAFRGAKDGQADPNLLPIS